MEISDKQWEQLVKRLDGVEQSIFDDRKSLDKMEIDMATIKGQLDRILAMQVRGQEKMEKTVHNAVGDVTEPLMDAVNELASKPINITEKQAKNLGMLQKLHKTIKSWK